MRLTYGTPIAFFAALIGLQLYHRNYMCIFCAFLLNTRRKEFQLLSKNFPSLSLLMITIEWIGAHLSNISNSHKQYFYSKEEHISWLGRWSGEFGHVSNFKFIPSDTQMAMIELDSQILSML